MPASPRDRRASARRGPRRRRHGSERLPRGDRVRGVASAGDGRRLVPSRCSWRIAADGSWLPTSCSRCPSRSGATECPRACRSGAWRGSGRRPRSRVTGTTPNSYPPRDGPLAPVVDAAAPGRALRHRDRYRRSLCVSRRRMRQPRAESRESRDRTIAGSRARIAGRRRQHRWMARDVVACSCCARTKPRTAVHGLGGGSFYICRCCGPLCGSATPAGLREPDRGSSRPAMAGAGALRPTRSSWWASWSGRRVWSQRIAWRLSECRHGRWRPRKAKSSQGPAARAP